ncbi:MAG: hypothetical protein HY062_01560 [Bacteroidetes bacterium]|nr:hypothetical protein [Bacteroidota bacterium]
MKFHAIIAICFIIGCSFVFQAGDEPLHIKFSNKDCHVEIDGFGNIYTINDLEIVKYNALGGLQKKFSTKRYGKIDFVDPSNPLKILVYYRDFQQIMFLDDQLTETSSMISLETLGYEQTSQVCSSANNSFWIYDKQNNELLRFDAELKPIVKTGNIKRILDVNIKPNFMKEHNNYLYLNCPNEGILVFDIYGTFYKTIPLKNLKTFKIVNGDVFYYENNTLKQYQAQSFNTIEKQFPDTLIKNVFWQNEKFYKVYKDSLVVD